MGGFNHPVGSPCTFCGSTVPMAVGSISSHCEKDVWSGSSTRTGLMLARLAITSRTKESSNVDDRTRRGSVASKKLEENQFAKLKRVVRVLSTCLPFGSHHSTSLLLQCCQWCSTGSYKIRILLIRSFSIPQITSLTADVHDDNVPSSPRPSVRLTDCYLHV